MADAVKYNTPEEVDQLFVDSACVILRDKVGGKDFIVGDDNRAA